MATLVSTLITKCRRRLNETSTTFHTAADLIAYCDEGQKYFVRETRCLEDTETTSASDGTQAYDIPDDFLALRRLTFDGKKLFRVSFQEIDEAEINETDSTATGTPKNFYIWNAQFYLIPIPGSSEDGDELIAYYYKWPTTISASDSSLEIESVYDDVVVTYMTYLGLLKDQKFDMADYHMTECNAKIMSIKRQMATDKLSRPPRLRVSRNLRTSEPFEGYY